MSNVTSWSHSCLMWVIEQVKWYRRTRNLRPWIVNIHQFLSLTFWLHDSLVREWLSQVNDIGNIWPSYWRLQDVDRRPICGDIFLSHRSATPHVLIIVKVLFSYRADLLPSITRVVHQNISPSHQDKPPTKQKDAYYKPKKWMPRNIAHFFRIIHYGRR